MLLDKVRKEKSTIDVELNGEIINKGSAKDTFIYIINYVSNIVGKELFYNDFPQIFNKEQFIVKNGKYSGHKYNTCKDDSNEYFIMTHTSTNDKKNTLEKISKMYNIELLVNVIDGVKDDFENENFENEILSNELEQIKRVCEATLEIKRCIEDNDFLCNKLNQADKNYVSSYYKKESGVVIDIRKDVAKEILLGGIDTESLLNIINTHKVLNKQKLKAWSNPYKILHPLVNDSYKDVDIFIKEFIEIIISKLGDVKYSISDFNGSQHQGSDDYWVAFYNKTHKHQSDGLQFFIGFRNGEMRYGIYRHIDRQFFDGEKIFDGDVNEFYRFVSTSSELILNDVEKSKDFVLNNIKEILQNNSNLPLTIKEINDRLDNKISSNAITEILKSDEFENDGLKYKIKNYMSTKLKDLFEKNGFITIDVLKQILEQNGITINI